MTRSGLLNNEFDCSQASRPQHEEFLNGIDMMLGQLELFKLREDDNRPRIRQKPQIQTRYHVASRRKLAKVVRRGRRMAYRASLLCPDCRVLEGIYLTSLILDDKACGEFQQY